MVKPLKSVAVLILAISLLAAFAVRQAAAQTESCVTDKCHASIGKEKVVHSPVKDNMCTTCHQAVQEPGKKTAHPGNLTITLAQQGADLCYMCHEPKNKKKIVHAPIMGGDCTSCHNPHGSLHKAMLRDAVPNICFQCHPGDMVNQQVVHPPAAAGDCSGCHDNHESDYANRLVQDGNALCFTCHPDKEEGLKSKKNAHPPVKQACVLCHNPHSSPNKAVLSSAVPALCSNCHPAEAKLTERAITKHGPMNDPRSCMNCHDPHYSDFSKMMTKPQLDLCLSCHDKEQHSEQGPIADMKSLLEQRKNGHGPLKDGDCVNCHNPHGSDYWRILARYYPPDFYTAYSDGKYGLCFSCHDSAAFAKLATDEATNFRHGRKNLHFVHVNKNVKGRSCRACHEVHADTGRPHHVREFIDFGGWSMPMNFKADATGGSCAPGCHGQKKYSR